MHGQIIFSESLLYNPEQQTMGLNLELEISLDDVRLMLRERFEQDYTREIHTATCTGCERRYNATIDVSEIWLNHIGDLIVEGRCMNCQTPISKYLETSNHQSAYDQAMAIRELHIQVLKDYNARPAGG